MKPRAVPSYRLFPSTEGCLHSRVEDGVGPGRGRGTKNIALHVFVALVAVVALMTMVLMVTSRIRPFSLLRLGPRMERAPIHALNSTFLVDTPGCHIPNLAVMSPEVREFIYDYGDVPCDGPPPLTRSDDDTLYLDRSLAVHYGVAPSALSCCARELWLRQANFSLPEVEGTNNTLLARFTLPPGGNAKFGDSIEYSDHCSTLQDATRAPAEFVRVECHAEGRELYRDFHGFVPPRVARAEERAGPRGERQDGLSVLLLGVDNVSRLNLLRNMPRVDALLRHLGGVTMLGYNKVDDYSYVNLVPLLAGQPSREMEKHCLLDNSVFFDPCPWVWKRFARLGYRTALMEDAPRLGLFHFHSPGFARRPVDADSRALLLAAERELPPTARTAHAHGHTTPVCLGPRLQIQGLFDYALKFVRAMVKSGAPFFHYVWGTSLTHDYLNQAQLADAPYERFINDLTETGVLNRTALVFLSDHGNRVGPVVATYQGHVEDRLPVLSFVLPAWWHQRFPLASATLRSNSRRLVTVMDVHETVLHLADLASLEEDRLRADAEEVARLADAGTPRRAVSLFLPVPPHRSCEQAGVKPHFCACVSLEPVATDHPQVLSAARLLVENVNVALEAFPMCAHLELGAVRYARRGEPSSILKRSDTPDRVREEEFLVTVETQPGGGLLAGTVRHLPAENVMRLSGRITRLNKYGNTSWCMPERELLMYCYCKDQINKVVSVS